LEGRACACLEVADSGCGIPERDFEKLFEPFYSSKFAGRGLGLCVVLGIVRSHHGVVTVESAPGRGSVFRVYFPILTEYAATKSIPASSPAPAKADGATLLLVDDEPNLLNMLATALSCYGYKVLTAQNGPEAVEIFRRHINEISLVLCDLTMPRMDGWDTLSAMRKLSPDIPVILSSGYSEAQAMEGEHSEMPQAFLRKPYELKTLCGTVSRLLTSEARFGRQLPGQTDGGDHA
jgi:CheY-like chemotaxis protein